MREIAITVKPTLSCNMKCKHCFNGEKLNKSGFIDIKKVKLLFKKASDEYKSIKVTFHGGEPTLAGINFYNDLFNFQRDLIEKTGVQFINLFTTNGLLLTEAFIDLLIKNNTLINVSYDGPYNDLLREKGGRVLHNIRIIQKKKGRVRCFITLSKGSYQHLNKIYDWFNENELDFKTLPIEKAGYVKDDESLIMDPIDFSRTLANVYKRWICDKNFKVRYYTFEEFSSLRRDKQFKPYWFNRKLAINPDGKIYPFGRPNDVNFSLGYPEEIDKIEEIFQSEKYIELRRILEGLYVKKCQKCESLTVCNGVAICMTYMYEEDENILEYSCYKSNLIFQDILKVNASIQEDFKTGKTDKYCKFIKHKFSSTSGKNASR